MTEISATTARGQCHCGRVSYSVGGPMRQVVECHCESCRRITGSVWHATGARRADVAIRDEASALTWYRSSEGVERGFCGHCGSTLFFRRDNGDTITITAGSLDQPTGLKLMMRIFTGERADYAPVPVGDNIESFPSWPPMARFVIPDA